MKFKVSLRHCDELAVARRRAVWAKYGQQIDVLNDDDGEHAAQHLQPCLPAPYILPCPLLHKLPAFAPPLLSLLYADRAYLSGIIRTRCSCLLATTTICMHT